MGGLDADAARRLFTVYKDIGATHRTTRRANSCRHRHAVSLLRARVRAARGTVLLAEAGLVLLGRTTGRGKDDQTGRPNRSIKEVLGYPLTRRFRQLLGTTETCSRP
jgi:hypothetical protein